LFDTAFSTFTTTTIASQAMGFRELGAMPSISDDGKMVVFYGDLSSAGADRLNASQPAVVPRLNAGAGVFLYGGVPRSIYRVNGVVFDDRLDPGERFDDANKNGVFDPGERDFDGFISYPADARIGVNESAIVFVANRSDESGVYRMSVSSELILGETLEKTLIVKRFGPPVPVLTTKEKVFADGSASASGTNTVRVGAFSGFSLHDPLNHRGDIAFSYATSSGGEGVLKAQIGPSAVIKMFKLRSEAVVATEGDLIDDPLPLVTDPSILAGQPEIKEGVFTDGVTPLLFQLDLENAGSVGEIILSIDSEARLRNGNHLEDRLLILQNGVWVKRSTVTLAANQTRVFVQLEALRAAELALPFADVGISSLTAKVGDNILGKATFKIQKPPIILIHGYNTQGNWERSFTDLLVAAGWPAGHIIPVKYGVEQQANESLATWGRLADLAGVLDGELYLKIENHKTQVAELKEWAFTRYYVVAHSQGGVLSRMLATANGVKKRSSFGHPPAFRSEENFFRGRFDRVVTIGSPHNGSRLLYYTLQVVNNFANLGGRSGFSQAAFSAAVITTSLGTYLFQGGIAAIMFQSNPDTRFAGTLQDKFDPFGSQIRELNDPAGTWQPDAKARFHLIRTRVQSPPSYPLFSLVGPNLRAVLPEGSDGVVDFASQGALPENGSARNVTSLTAKSISHSGPVLLFGADGPLAYDVASADVASVVADLLNNPESGAFDAFPNLAALDITKDKARIDLAAATPITVALVARLLGVQALAADTTATFRFNPVAAILADTKPTWFLDVYDDPAKSSTVKLVTDAADPALARVTIPGDVKGDVVLRCSYIAESGQTYLGEPVLVQAAKWPPLTGLVLEPRDVSVVKGQELQLSIQGVFGGSQTNVFYIAPNEPMEIISSQPGVVEVSPSGVARMKAGGTSVVTVHLRGFTASATLRVSEDVFQPALRLATNGATPGFTIHGQVSGGYTVRISEDLQAWSILATNVPVSAFFPLTQSNRTRLFYQAVLP
jgi:pimeloyl-ACP methyl ester carboxylesterase